LTVRTTEAGVNSRQPGAETRRPALSRRASALDVADDAVFLLDPDRKIVQYNEVAEKLLTKATSKLAGRFCYGVVHGTSEPVPWYLTVRILQSRHNEISVVERGDHRLEIAAHSMLDGVGVTHTISYVKHATTANIALAAEEDGREPVNG